MGPVDALLETIAGQVAGLPQATLRALVPVLEEAEKELRRDLARWLARATNGAERFTAQHYRNALIQIQSALAAAARMEKPVAGALVAGGRAAGRLATGHLKAELEVFGQVFQHSVRPIPLEVAGIISKGDGMLMRRFATSAARYVGNVRADITRHLALGVVRGETLDQLKMRLIRLGGPRGVVALKGILGQPGAEAEFISEGLFARYGSWAERLARTEVIHAYNTHAHTGLELYASEDEGALKRWDAALDRRVCLDCRDMHGRVTKVDGYFPGGYKYPPLHPNCRCAVVAWHKEWTEAEVYGRGPALEVPRGVTGGIDRDRARVEVPTYIHRDS